MVFQLLIANMRVLEESGMKRLQAAMTALAATLLLSIGLTYSASAASIGYGILLGTWGLGGGNLTNSYSADDLEAAIAADNPSTEPFASLGTGLNQFESAGKIDFPSTTTGRITFTSNGGLTGGTWTYNPSAIPPGNVPVDLYLAVKYDSVVSLFYYASVDPLSADNNGDWTTDALVGGFTSCGDLSSSDRKALNGEDCMPYQANGNPIAGSNIEGFWPPPTVVPLPAALPLLLVGLAGLGLISHRRKAA